MARRPGRSSQSRVARRAGGGSWQILPAALAGAPLAPDAMAGVPCAALRSAPGSALGSSTLAEASRPGRSSQRARSGECSGDRSWERSGEL